MKRNYTINLSVPRATFWKVIVPLGMLFLIAGGIAGIFFMDRVVMSRIVNIHTRGIIQVPSIIHLSWEEAREKLYKTGLRLEVQDREYCDTLMSDIVVSQRPGAGESVKKGRHIFVVLSKGPEIGTIPDVKKLTERGAKKILNDAGFENVKEECGFNEKIEKELVIGSIPEAGTRTSREIVVEISISNGPRPTSAVVPNIIGEILSNAKSIIDKSGLVVGKIDYKISATSKPGLVISQSLSPGTHAPLKSAVNLIIAASK